MVETAVIAIGGTEKNLKKAHHQNKEIWLVQIKCSIPCFGLNSNVNIFLNSFEKSIKGDSEHEKTDH